MPADTPSATAGQPSFEEALGKLESIVHELEEGQIGLADSLGRYEEGIRLLKQCYALLEQAEQRIELLTGLDGDGNPVAVPFDNATAVSLEEKAQSRARRRSQAGHAAKAPQATEIDSPRDLF